MTEHDSPEYYEEEMISFIGSYKRLSNTFLKLFVISMLFSIGSFFLFSKYEFILFVVIGIIWLMIGNYFKYKTNCIEIYG